MTHHIRIKLPLLISLIICLTGHAVAQIDSEIPIADYVFETIEVPGVDFLEVAASNDFGDYAGNALGPDGKKKIGFTLIDGVFKTYDFPGSLNTYFYALDNTGKAAGHYKDSNNLYHGVIMEDGKLTQYDFPGAAETHIYGLSDETGALSGNIVDAAGVTPRLLRRADNYIPWRSQYLWGLCQRCRGCRRQLHRCRRNVSWVHYVTPTAVSLLLIFQQCRT